MSRTVPRRRLRMATLACALVSALGATACTDYGGSGGGENVDGQPASRAAAAGETLAGACPDPLVVQTNWWPQAEYGGLYRLLGENSQVDAAEKTVSGPLVDGGTDTGVRIELRSGGPANSFTPAATTLYVDPSVTLGGADLEQAARLSREQPVLGVFAPMERSPLVIMWDPDAHPDVDDIAGLGRAGTRVLFFQGSTYMAYLTGAGVLRADQVEGSYDGTPARFVAEDGAVAQQGYLTNEVYQYEHELPQWKRKVEWQLVADAGFPTYPETLTIRADRKDELAPCLRRLVPVLQRSTAAYVADPKPTNDLIVRLVDDFGAFAYSAQRAEHAVTVMAENGIVGNGDDATVGDFDEGRVQRLVDIVSPVFAEQRTPVRDGLRPTDLYTNEFIDPSIGAAP